MDVFIYAADLYCQDCGEDIRATLLKDGCDFDLEDGSSFDSDDCPKGPYPDGVGEADCPQHCGAGKDCLNAIKLDDGCKVGAWLENALTTDGVEYVREKIREGGEVAKLWEDFYSDSLEEDVEVLTNKNNCPIPYAAIRKAMDGENFTMSLVGDDIRVVVNAVNIGIDSRLQACNGKDDDYHAGEWTIGERVVSHILECSVSPESLPVLLRRLFDDMGEEDSDGGVSLAGSILTSLGFSDCGVFVGREALGLN